MRFYLTAIAVLVLFAASIAGSYQIFKIHTSQTLEEEATASFQAGDYLASLERYAALKRTAGEEKQQAVTKKVEETKQFLVASELYQRAREAAEKGNWFEVKALLQKGEATTNEEFMHYSDAVELYVTAANKVKEIERKIETELAQMRKEAKQAKEQREEAEQTAATVKEQLEETKQVQQQTAQALEQTKTEAELAKEEARQERLEKFLNELELYTDMLARGSRHLEDAFVEIEQERGPAARAFIDQAQTLFDEVAMRADGLRENRTPHEHIDIVRQVTKAATLFNESAGSAGKATFNIGNDEQELNEFLSSARHSRNAANSVVAQVRSFISSKR